MPSVAVTADAHEQPLVMTTRVKRRNEFWSKVWGDDQVYKKAGQTSRSKLRKPRPMHMLDNIRAQNLNARVLFASSAYCIHSSSIIYYSSFVFLFNFMKLI